MKRVLAVVLALFAHPGTVQSAELSSHEFLQCRWSAVALQTLTGAIPSDEHLRFLAWASAKHRDDEDAYPFDVIDYDAVNGVLGAFIDALGYEAVLQILEGEMTACDNIVSRACEDEGARDQEDPGCAAVAVAQEHVEGSD